MIDVVMLLIVFFTLTSQFRDAMPSRVELPRESGQEEVVPAPAAIDIEIDRDGNLSSHGKSVTIEEVIAELPQPGSDAAPSASRVELVLRADRLCAVGAIDRVATALVRAGIQRLKIVTAGSPAPPPPASTSSGGGNSP